MSTSEQQNQPQNDGNSGCNAVVGSLLILGASGYWLKWGMDYCVQLQSANRPFMVVLAVVILHIVIPIVVAVTCLFTAFLSNTETVPRQEFSNTSVKGGIPQKLPDWVLTTIAIVKFLVLVPVLCVAAFMAIGIAAAGFQLAMSLIALVAGLILIAVSASPLMIVVILLLMSINNKLDK